MAEDRVDFLIVGGGVAGYSCARELREAGAEGSVALVTRELDEPYDRTSCSKAYLRGEQPREAALLAGSAWWPEHGIDLRTGTSAVELDLAERSIRLSDKRTVRFGQALLATGANVRRLRVEGSELAGIHYLRTLGNADAIRTDAEGAEHVVLVGGSYIATELAASLTMLGRRCTLVMQEGVTLERGFGPRAGRFFQDVLESHGVEIVASDELERFEGANGRVTHVITARGRRLPADLVILGVGAVPDVTLAKRAGLAIGATGGVMTDASLQTPVEGVFAAGDSCEYESVVHRQARMRVEHWEVAAAQGRAAARGMLEGPRPYEAIPYFFSDLADWTSVEYVGPALTWDEEVVRGSIDDGAFTLLYLDAGRVVAGLTVGRGEDLDGVRELIRSHAHMGESRSRLADPDVALESVGAASSGAPAAAGGSASAQPYVCQTCGYIYDPSEGDDAGAIDPGTPFEGLPDSWTCPVCGSQKSDFAPGDA